MFKTHIYWTWKFMTVSLVREITHFHETVDILICFIWNKLVKIAKQQFGSGSGEHQHCEKNYAPGSDHLSPDHVTNVWHPVHDWAHSHQIWLWSAASSIWFQQNLYHSYYCFVPFAIQNAWNNCKILLQLTSKVFLQQETGCVYCIPER